MGEIIEPPTQNSVETCLQIYCFKLRTINIHQRTHRTIYCILSSTTSTLLTAYDNVRIQINLFKCDHFYFPIHRKIYKTLVVQWHRLTQ